jgi:hypothetical protein
MKKIFTKEKTKKAYGMALKVFSYFLAGLILLFMGVFLAMRLHLTNVNGSIDALSQFFNKTQDTGTRKKAAEQTMEAWATSAEWQTLGLGFEKDKSIILQASSVSGVTPRLILSVIIPEQFRFFTSNREAFKKFFQPLQMLGNYTQFSYGIAGIKTDTAIMVENNLKDSTSPFYLGLADEHLLDFTTTDPDTERMTRLTDPHNHYYSYLYTALLLKEEMAQWQRAGFPINNRPEILATLFNIGFSRSLPNAIPLTGGAPITINGEDYTFGSLAFSFYYSNELTQYFPN